MIAFQSLQFYTNTETRNSGSHGFSLILIATKQSFFGIVNVVISIVIGIRQVTDYNGFHD